MSAMLKTVRTTATKLANGASKDVASFVGGGNLNVASGALGALNSVKQNVTDFLSDTGFGKAARMVNLLIGANPRSKSFTDGSWGSSAEHDWRVRLSLPPGSFMSSPLLQPLIETNGLIFPYTPQLMMQHDAGYQQVTPVHSNYPYFAYQNSDPKAMLISGAFLIENAVEAAYWIAVVQYLRSVTKMAYGETSNQGSPPPVVKLTGYGDYILPKVPVIITNFTVNLEPDVDYMRVDIGPNGTWVPLSSMISVTCQPIYSRRKVAKFSLDKFIAGDSIINGDGFL